MDRGWCALVVFVALLPLHARGAEPPVSDESDECITCHEEVTPGIVASWRRSRHAQVPPATALGRPELQRRMSATAVPDKLKGVVVGCYECHSQNAAAHKDNFEHFDYRINVVVSPNDCAVCHPVEAKEYGGSKKAHALDNLQKNPVYHALVDTVTGVKTVGADGIHGAPGSETAKAETCYACHGTRVEVKGLRTVDTDAGETKLPILTNWPNQGVGRVNPDGSRGSCTACHARHAFSIELARKPATCGQCHLEPDVPAFNIYKESKHGNLYASHHTKWNWDRVPWRVGRDTEAPTCATCHNSLLVGADDETIVARRTHDFGARLWVRLFGLPYSHPQPKDGRTHLIKNADGLPLPTTFTGQPATEFLLAPKEAAQRQAGMKALCGSCHGSTWVNGHFAKMDATVREADAMVLASTKLLLQAWDA